MVGGSNVQPVGGGGGGREDKGSLDVRTWEDGRCLSPRQGAGKQARF